jgi:hypothetical protein
MDGQANKAAKAMKIATALFFDIPNPPSAGAGWV